MKKYITLAVLLAAGAAFANAGEKTLTTTFVTAAQSDVMAVVTSDSWGGDASGETAPESWCTALGNSSGSALSLFTNGSAGTDATVFAPNQNLLNDSWTANFFYTPEISALGQIGQITLNVGYFMPTTGNWSNATSYSAGDIAYTITVKEASGVTLGSFTGTLTESSLPSSGDLSSLSVVLTRPSAVRLDSLTGEDPIQVSIATGKSTSANGVALRSITFSSIPEPSTFGLLAGLGAIALVGTRRRRR